MAGAAFMLVRNVSAYRFDEIQSSLTSISISRAIGMLAFAAGSYICLTGFDWLALKYVGRALPYRRVALASFAALSLGHNIGFAALSSGAIRYRFYSRWGLKASEIAKLIIFCGVTVFLGLVTLGALALVVVPELAGAAYMMTPAYARALGCALLTIPLGYICLAATRVSGVKYREWSLNLPPTHLALCQVLLGTMNFALVAACLHQALSALSEVSYWSVTTIYVLANTLGIASHAPGGIGVVEAVVVFLLPGSGSVAGVILFRLAYYILPLGLGLAALAISEFLLRGSRGSRSNAAKDSPPGE